MAVKIDNSSINNAANAGIRASQSNSSSANVKESNPFQAVMKNARLDNFNGTMQDLLSIVRGRGEDFVHSPQEDTLNSYRESVKYFLKKIRDEFLSLKEEFGASRDGEQRVYQLVEKANGEADSLTQEAFTKDKALDLLASLDDIRGMIIDVIG